LVSGDTYAALDIGSNTIRMLLARVDDGKFERLLDLSEFARLGKDVDRTQELSAERMGAAIEAIRSEVDEARARGAKKVFAVATSAVRDARNGEDFTKRVREETGIDVEIVSGEREAELTYRGAVSGIDVRGGAIIADLGGGSTEIIGADESGMKWAQSLQLGSNRLSEKFVERDPPSDEELDRVAAYMERRLQSLPATSARRVIFTGGTATHVAYLSGAEGDVASLRSGDLRSVRRVVQSKPAAVIAEEFGIKLARAEVLAAGVRALEAIAAHYEANEITVTSHGIREGILLSHEL